MAKAPESSQGWAYHEVHVTQAAIDRAVRANSYHCAVAEAIKESIPGAERPNVDIQTIRFSVDADDTRYIYLTPSDVQRYIVAFDNGETLKPFSFTLRRAVWMGPMFHRDKSSRGDPQTGTAFVRELGDSGSGGTVAVHHAPKIRRLGTSSARIYGMRNLRMNTEQEESE